MESVIARVIAALVGLLALAFVGTMGYKLYSSERATKLAADVNMLINNARGQFAQDSTGYASFANANFNALNTAGLFPPDMVRAGGLFDSWGNAVVISSSGGGGQGTIQFGGGNAETADQCTAVVNALKDYVSLAVGATVFTQAAPATSVTAAVACAGGGPAITLTFQ